MYTVITTVGTSLFENYCKNERNSKISIQTVEDFREKTKKATKDDYENFKEEREEIKNIISRWAEESNENASAEIKSLLKIQEKLNDDLNVHLIATDTLQSYLAAEIIRDSLQHKNILYHQEIHWIEGLQVENAAKFKRTGMPKLMATLKDLKNKCNNCILNISGGYKVVIPYLTIMGQLFEMDLYYIYEDSDELIEIPALPFNLDWVFAEKVYEPMHRDNLSGLDKSSEVFEELRKYMFIDEEGNLTGLGIVIKEYIQQNYDISRDFLGYFMEYKILEYYLKNEDKQNKYAERGIKFCGNEFDVILSDSPNTRELAGNIIVIESKLFGGLEQKDNNQNYKLEEQIYKKVNLLKEKNKILNEFHLCIFLTSRNQENIITGQKFDSRFVTIAQKIKESSPNCSFKVFIAKIISNHITDNDRVIYQNIAKEPLDSKTFYLYKEF